MQEIADLLVRKQLRAVAIYTHLRRHDAAAIVLDRVLEEEPTATILDEVLFQRARVATRLDDEETALATYRRLLDEYPDSKLRGQASRAIAALNQEAPDDDESS